MGALSVAVKYYFDEDHDEMRMRRAVERGTRDAHGGSSGTGAVGDLVGGLLTAYFTVILKVTAAILGWLGIQAWRAWKQRRSEQEL